ncbi:MAG: bifunctional riboflavin kinase/FAD synthetase [Tenuifilaceae bacterium]|nr:bifunctional riboflavin kinase/FAD synthetase [Tenuifilaceae bacterium]
MKTVHNATDLQFDCSTVTIGFFDGVHLGHKSILRHTLNKADELRCPSVVLSFWPHPRIVLGKDARDLRLLSTLTEKQELLQKMGVNAFLQMEFTRELAALPAEDFIKNILVDELKAKHIVVGFNHHFGKGGKGDFNLLNQLAHKYGYTTEQVGATQLNGLDVSSTKIRNYLDDGNLDVANQMLGYNYSITGTIEGGQQIGRSIGFPTANINPIDPHKILPKLGVYAVWVTYNGIKYPAMLNIGIRPTIGNNLKLTVEAHIIGFNQNIYNQEITIEFVKRIRDEVKFTGLADLKAQLERDRLTVLRTLNEIGK